MGQKVWKKPISFCCGKWKKKRTLHFEARANRHFLQWLRSDRLAEQSLVEVDNQPKEPRQGHIEIVMPSLGKTKRAIDRPILLP